MLSLLGALFRGGEMTMEMLEKAEGTNSLVDAKTAHEVIPPTVPRFFQKTFAVAKALVSVMIRKFC